MPRMIILKIALHQIFGVSEIEIKSWLQLSDLLALVHLSQLEVRYYQLVFLWSSRAVSKCAKKRLPAERVARRLIIGCATTALNITVTIFISRHLQSGLVVSRPWCTYGTGRFSTTNERVCVENRLVPVAKSAIPGLEAPETQVAGELHWWWRACCIIFCPRLLQDGAKNVAKPIPGLEVRNILRLQTENGPFSSYFKHIVYHIWQFNAFQYPKIFSSVSWYHILNAFKRLIWYCPFSGSKRWASCSGHSQISYYGRPRLLRQRSEQPGGGRSRISGWGR